MGCSPNNGEPQTANVRPTTEVCRVAITGTYRKKPTHGCGA